MAPAIVHLPNGQTLTVTPVFGGLGFRSNDLNTHQNNPFPPGWTIILHSEDEDNDENDNEPNASSAAHTRPALDYNGRPDEPPRRHTHRYKAPTLRNDHLFISSISNPSSSDFRPASSPTRQIAMMLWATLWWYFHQPAPSPYITNSASDKTPEAGRPKGEWRIYINKEGIFKGKHLMAKLERMGLVASEDSTVGLDPEDGVHSSGASWCKMFVSQRSFWQLDARIYLFSLPAANAASASPYPALSPAGSRPASPSRGIPPRSDDITLPTHFNRTTTPPGPFSSGSHLPTFYPPPPPQYTFTKGVRHPIRPKPPRQGEVFYSRYVPSLGQYLSFRVASLGKNPVVYRGPTSHCADPLLTSREILRAHHSSDSSVPTLDPVRVTADPTNTASMSDTDLLHKWMNDPRISYSWGEQGPTAHQEAFLKTNLSTRHSFPVIGCFDGKPFGYFELYWVKEDKLSAQLEHCDDYDRGIHCLVGEQDFRGPHRIKVWLSALVHYLFLADMRTNTVMMEPRVDNEKLRKYCEEVGFYKEKEVTFPHKQSNLMKMQREAFECPAL